MKRKLNCILLIDDDEPTNFLNKMIVEQAGCTSRVRVMQSAKEALHYFDKEDPAKRNKDFVRPELIFLDINMPAMNGWEFLDRYGKFAEAEKSKICMLTTSLNPDDAVKAKEIPLICGYEHKPLTQDGLDRILRSYFPDRF